MSLGREMPPVETVSKGPNSLSLELLTRVATDVKYSDMSLVVWVYSGACAYLIEIDCQIELCVILTGYIE
jgi:hypothetical protein